MPKYGLQVWYIGSRAVEPELKFQAPALAPAPAPAPGITIFWLQFRLRLQLLKVSDSGFRMIWFIEIWKPLYHLYNSLALQIGAVEPEPKFQAPSSTPPFKSFWLRRQSSKIAWAPDPTTQPWLEVSGRSTATKCFALSCFVLGFQV